MPPRPLLIACLMGFLASVAAADTFTVRIDPAFDGPPRDGRLILFFAGPTMRGWQDVRPMDGPFFQSPQPIASVAVTGWKSGETRSVGADAVGSPGPPATLSGTYRVQAVLDADDTERCHTDGPGNLFSDPISVTLDPAKDERFEIVLNGRVGTPPSRADSENLKWVRVPSPLLSAFYGRPVMHRAGVALPKGYLDPARAEERWPAIYVVPAYGGRDDDARIYAMLHAQRGSEAVAPQAVHVVLDPEAPLGHHGFVDSANNGPRETALVAELIPYLEKTFRLDARPEARIVTGHSSGGWTSLWLALRRPETFGACWATSPDPVDFTAFQMSDLYADANVYTDAAGDERPSFRQRVSRDEMRVLMTVRQESLMEHALDPAGGSGQQWDAWEAMFSPRDPATGMPRPVFAAGTGVIDRDVAAAWRAFDITHMIAANRERYGAVMAERVRLACGTEDSFYLNRAVERLDAVTRLGREPADPDAGQGFIMLVEGANHFTVTAAIFIRWNEQMRAWLEGNGYRQ